MYRVIGILLGIEPIVIERTCVGSNSEMSVGANRDVDLICAVYILAVFSSTPSKEYALLYQLSLTPGSHLEPMHIGVESSRRARGLAGRVKGKYRQ